MGANKGEYGFPRLLRLDQFSSGGGLKRGKHAGWWVRQPAGFSLNVPVFEFRLARSLSLSELG